jgi:hypothetical protein
MSGARCVTERFTAIPRVKRAQYSYLGRLMRILSSRNIQSIGRRPIRNVAEYGHIDENLSIVRGSTLVL